MFQFQRFSTPLARVVLFVCSVLLAIQLVGASFHDHDTADQLSDCISCQIAQHAITDLPAVDPVLLATFLAVAYVLARVPRPIPVVLRRYLIPTRQAPPRLHISIR